MSAFAHKNRANKIGKYFISSKRGSKFYFSSNAFKLAKNCKTHISNINLRRLATTDTLLVYAPLFKSRCAFVSNSLIFADKTTKNTFFIGFFVFADECWFFQRQEFLGIYFVVCERYRNFLWVAVKLRIFSLITCINFFTFPGHDTTCKLSICKIHYIFLASGMAWTLWLLAHHQKFQKRIFDEVDRIFGKLLIAFILLILVYRRL